MTAVDTYPSHGFVIDRRDAGKLFKNIREPTIEEDIMAQMLAPVSRVPAHNGYTFEFLSYKQQDAKGERNGKGVSTEKARSGNANKNNRTANNRGNTRSPEPPKQPISRKKIKPNS